MLQVPAKIANQKPSASVPPERETKMPNGALWHLKAARVTFGVAALISRKAGKRDSSWFGPHCQQLHINALMTCEI